MSNNLCKKCFFYGEPLCSYQYNTKRDVNICKYFKEIPQTVFDQITASPEVLAEKLAYRYDGNGTWRSFLLYGYEFLTKEEAIAATAAKLKGVEK
jgi:hypothetical protein